MTDEMCKSILNMSNKVAANVLKRMLFANSAPIRGNGKSITTLMENMALSKAIDLLEATPDKKEE